MWLRHELAGVMLIHTGRVKRGETPIFSAPPAANAISSKFVHPPCATTALT